jgi:phosphotransferase system HPr (HPr) family protein
MIKATVKITNESGLHARPASQFEEMANSFTSDITIEKEDGKICDGKSIVDILYIVIKKGDTITLSAEGLDEKEAIDSLIALIIGFKE